MTRLNDDWKDWPLGRPEGVPEGPQLVVSFGGIGPIPGTDKAKAQGCICPGLVGDKDRWGRDDGHTIDQACSLHGKEARKKHLAAVRKEQRKNWADLEARERANAS